MEVNSWRSIASTLSGQPTISQSVKPYIPLTANGVYTRIKGEDRKTTFFLLAHSIRVKNNKAVCGQRISKIVWWVIIWKTLLKVKRDSLSYQNLYNFIPASRFIPCFSQKKKLKRN